MVEQRRTRRAPAHGRLLVGPLLILVPLVTLACASASPGAAPAPGAGTPAAALGGDADVHDSASR